MAERKRTDRDARQRTFSEQVSAKVTRKVRARRQRARSVWFGLGTFGMVGWSVAVPTLLGIALGLWLDSRYPGRISWTLTFLFGGLAVGCFNAWYWVSREREMIEREREEQTDE